MTIHHDKMAYGKLEKTSEELSEEKIAEMLKKLKSGEEENSGNPQEERASRKGGKNK